MPKTRDQKEKLVQTLQTKLSKSKSLVFADYRGMTMGQISDIRTKLREQGAEFNVTKNSLLLIALKDVNKPVADEKFLSGPVATLFAYDDEITPIKTLVKAFKDNNIGVVKAGFLGTDFLNTDQVQHLAALPSKTEMHGQVVGVLAAPLQGIVGVLSANIRNLAIVIDQIRKQQGGE